MSEAKMEQEQSLVLEQMLTQLPGHALHFAADGSGELLGPNGVAVQTWEHGMRISSAISACSRQIALVGSRDAQIARRQVWEEIALEVRNDVTQRRGTLRAVLKARCQANGVQC